MENQMNYGSECSLFAIAHSGQITVLNGPRIAGNENGPQTIEQAFQALLQHADLLVPPQNRHHGIFILANDMLLLSSNWIHHTDHTGDLVS